MQKRIIVQRQAPESKTRTLQQRPQKKELMRSEGKQPNSKGKAIMKIPTRKRFAPRRRIVINRRPQNIQPTQPQQSSMMDFVFSDQGQNILSRTGDDIVSILV